MNCIRQTMLLIKRILCRPAMLVVLMLIPASLIILSLLPARTRDTEIVSGIYIQAHDSYTDVFSDYLLNTSTGFVFRIYESENAMKDAVASGDIDAGYMLPDGISSRIISGDSRGCVTVFTTPATSFQAVTAESVYAALLRAYAPAMSVHMLESRYLSGSQTVDTGDINSYIDEHFNSYIDDQDIFTIQSSLADSDSNAVSGTDSQDISPNNLPVEALIYMTIFICALLGLQNYLKDLDDGVYSILSPYARASFCAKNIAAGIIPAAIVNYISLLIYSGCSRPLYYLLCIAGVVLVCLILCLLFRLIFRHLRAYSTALPFIIICTLLLSLLSMLSQM